ncbi:MAG: hypothetical protein DID90_2727553682 [Candidatus Nitrotoga sp. LAW]|nr:MAG: hypothetical protein DID90_2727553682 [Candidatus Nitrotoga sp. LAW]
MLIGICNEFGGVRTGLDRTAYQVEMIVNKIAGQPVSGYGQLNALAEPRATGSGASTCSVCGPYSHD